MTAATAVSPGHSKLLASISDMDETHDMVSEAIIGALINCKRLRKSDSNMKLSRDATQFILDGLTEPELLHIRQYGIRSPVFVSNLTAKLTKLFAESDVPGEILPHIGEGAERETPWSEAPSWAQFRAMNRDGLYRWHEYEPEYNHQHGIWTNIGRVELCVDPSDSLERRPE